MGKIYKGQTDLTIEVNTGKDLTGVTSVKIAFKKPNGIVGFFNPTITNIKSGIIVYYAVNPTDINIAGTWKIWAEIIDSQGLVSIGETSTFNVFEKGS